MSERMLYGLEKLLANCSEDVAGPAQDRGRIEEEKKEVERRYILLSFYRSKPDAGEIH